MHQNCRNSFVFRNTYFITQFLDCDTLVVKNLTLASQILVLYSRESDCRNPCRSICGALHADLSTTKEQVKKFRQQFEQQYSPSDPRKNGTLNSETGWSSNSRLKQNHLCNFGPKMITSVYGTLPRKTSTPLGVSRENGNIENLSRDSSLWNQKDISNLKGQLLKPVFTRSASTDRIALRRSKSNNTILNSKTSNVFEVSTPIIRDPSILSEASTSHTRHLSGSNTKSGMQGFMKWTQTTDSEIISSSSSRNFQQCSAGTSRSLSLRRKKLSGPPCAAGNNLHIEALSFRIRQVSECSAVTDGDSGVVSDTNSFSETATSSTAAHIKLSTASDVTLTPNDTLSANGVCKSPIKTRKDKLNLYHVILFHKDGLIFDCFLDILREFPEVEVHHFPLIEDKQTDIVINSNCKVDFKLTQKFKK